MTNKQLIVNADDYGITAGVSAGIRHAHLKGIVTSTTTLMGRPNVETELLIAAKECPALGVGVHLNLTSGGTLLSPGQVPSLIKVMDKHDHGLHRIDLLDQINIAEVEAEWRAQIDKFVHITGRAPDHLDSHHHSSYLTPELFNLMLQLAREYHCPIRNPLPSLADPRAMFDDLPINLRARTEQEVPKLLRAANDVPRPDTFLHSFYDETATRETLLRIIDSIPEGTAELMTHPGYYDKELADFSVYNEPRARELDLLTEPAVRDRAAANHIELISFSKLIK